MYHIFIYSSSCKYIICKVISYIHILLPKINSIYLKSMQNCWGIFLNMFYFPALCQSHLPAFLKVLLTWVSVCVLHISSVEYSFNLIFFIWEWAGFSFIQFSLLAQSWLNLYDPMDCSMPDFPVHQQLLELTQTQVHWVGDAIQPSHPLSSPSPPTFNLSQHQGLFKWVSSSHQVAKVLEFQLQYQSFQWIFRTDFLWDRLVGSPCSPWNSQESSPTPKFKSINFSGLSFLYTPIFTSLHDYWKKHSFH